MDKREKVEMNEYENIKTPSVMSKSFEIKNDSFHLVSNPLREVSLNKEA